jgi:hypothetical protein
MTAMRVPCALLTLAVIVVGEQNMAAECIRIALRNAKPGTHFVFEAIATKAVALSGSRNIVDLDVARMWKGKVHPHSRLFYDLDSLDAQRLEVGKRYIVFAPWFAFLDFTDARRVPVDLPDGSCGWGVPYEDVEAELPTLGKATRAR